MPSAVTRMDPEIVILSKAEKKEISYDIIYV